jgi:hypothetical protein
VLVIIGGIIQTGGPFYAKNIKLDEERLNNFNEISFEIRSIYRSSQKLPPNLEYVTENKVSAKKLKINDPETNKAYEYKIISATTYELCANFSTDSREISEKYEDYYFYDSYKNKMKNHKKGYDCISYTINPKTSNEDEYYDEYSEEDYYLEEEYPYISDSPEENEDSANSRDAERKLEVTRILNAIGAYAADNSGALPAEITTTVRKISRSEADLCADLVPVYIPTLPTDPDSGFADIGELSESDCQEYSYDTGYTIIKDSDDKVTVSAPLAEAEEILITR